jgi:hypothetical protein
MIAAALTFLRAVPGMLSPRAWIAVGVLILFLGFGAYCAQKAAQGERDRQAAQTARIERKASTGRETAAAERLNDTLNSQAREKELSDAVSSLPDARPSDRRIALACQRLRQQRVAERDLPAECGPRD